jgi:ribonuclease Z
LFSESGVYAGDIAARTTHRSSLDVFEARGGTLPRLRPAPKVTEIHAGSVIEGTGWKITVAHAQHAQPYLECVALRLDSAEGSICYSGDSGGVANSVVQLAKGCDLFIAMNHFFSGTEPTPAFRLATGNHLDNAEVARRAGVKTLVLTHLTEQIDQPTIREQIVHEIRRVFDGKLIWGEDLMTLNTAGAKVAAIERRTVAQE